MFDLTKDLGKYAGIPPYASEMYGVYQPLLGWQSRLTKNWLQQGGSFVDDRIKRILDGRIVPGPTEVLNPVLPEFLARPLDPGSGKSPWSVSLAKDLGSELLRQMLPQVHGFVRDHDGRLPRGDEWNQIFEINAMMDPDEGQLRRVNDALRQRRHNELLAQLGPAGLTPQVHDRARQDHLARMQYESQIAAFLLFHAEAQPGYDPDALAQLYRVTEAAPLSDVLRPTDPLANIDPRDTSGALSPVGFVHLFRQYFFNLGTFLGEPVEHIWLSPGTTIELVEVSTRRTLIERALEEALETTSRAEQTSSVKEELSDAVREENESSAKFGFSTTHGVNAFIYQGSATTSFGLDSSRKEAREKTHKQSREEGERLATEIKRSVKSVFKTVTETTDTRSRRHVISNTTGELRNYELRRKMRRVGVQLQDLGVQLCWQVFIDDPAAQLGLSELVHFAESPDLAGLKMEDVPAPVSITQKVVAPIPFSPILDYTNNRANYEYAYVDPPGTQYAGKHLSIIKGDEDDDDSQTIMGPFRFMFDPPKAGYVLTPDIRVVGVQGNKIGIVREVKHNAADGSFEIVMQRVNFGGDNALNLEVELVFAPGAAAMADYDARKKAAQAKYDADKERLTREAYAESVRSRITAASTIRPRPSWDLREEERTVVYRKLIERLMLDSWKLPDDAASRRISHVRSEVVRAIFDTDAMLYFVAPEWWMPRRRRGRLNLDTTIADRVHSLTGDDTVMWGGEKRPDNYRITEDSAPAKLGSSLGWLLQLDADNMRNAFLNAPWVKAVIPIRPGRENAALNWLRSIEGHTDDGWDTPYLGTHDDDAEFAGKSVGQVLAIIADRLAAENTDMANVLQPDRVFEKGFDHLAGGFDAGLDAREVFSQWISVLPTDQIVAVEYQATELFTE
jgi:hypothetical protein